mmetsp:Transcript_9353/g.8833  ORF Transcript_9353/g.8833 Transcript_9353/m.8833 type:complete len:89 (+) Transcript_9353:1441-1707(+)
MEGDPSGVAENIGMSQIVSSKRKRKFKKSQNEITLSGRSLFILREDSTIRVKLKKVLEHPYFEGFIYHLIFLNCLMLAMSEPVLTDDY